MEEENLRGPSVDSLLLDESSSSFSSVEPQEMTDINALKQMYEHAVDMPLPPLELSSESLQELLKEANFHCSMHGYALVIVRKRWRQGPYKPLSEEYDIADLACDRHGKSKSLSKPLRRPSRGSRKTDCRMKMQAYISKVSGLWELKPIFRLHNHNPSSNPSVHPIHRRLNALEREIINAHAFTATAPRNILAEITQKNPQTNLVLRDIYNALAATRRKRLTGETVPYAFLNFLETNSFFSSYTHDPETGYLEDIFIAHPKSITRFKENSDVLILDCTYKTNTYKSLALNIIGVTGNNSSLQLGLCLIKREAESNFTWALQVLLRLFNDHSISLPTVIFTDQAVALVNAIELVFPGVPSILCLWHVQKNVATFAKKNSEDMKDTERTIVQPQGGLKKIRVETEAFIEFMKNFNACVYAKTEAEFKAEFEKLKKRSVPVAAYIQKQYFSRWADKLLRYRTNQVLHYGICSTSRGEGNHHVLKGWLRTSTRDPFGLVEILQTLWSQQDDQYNLDKAKAEQIIPSRLSTPFWQAVVKIIWPHALNLTYARWESRGLKKAGEEPCSKTLWQSQGLPCTHIIRQLIANRAVLMPEHFDKHWWIDRSAAPERHERVLLAPLPSLQEQTRLFKIANTHCRGSGSRRIRREPNAFELTSASSLRTPSLDPQSSHGVLPSPLRARAAQTRKRQSSLALSTDTQASSIATYQRINQFSATPSNLSELSSFINIDVIRAGIKAQRNLNPQN